MSTKRKQSAPSHAQPAKLSRHPSQKTADAVKAGNLELVKKLLSSNQDLDPGNNSWDQGDDVAAPCLLQVAAEHEQLAVMQLLVERFGVAWRNAPNILRNACSDGALPVVQFCINTLKLDACLGGHQETPMFWACRNGQLDVVQFLAQSCPGTLLLDGAFRMRLLFVAANNGHLAVSQHLMQSPAFQSGCWRCDDKRRTVLHLAAAGGHTEIVRAVLKSVPHHKARHQILLNDDEGCNVIVHSVLSDSVEIMQFLVTYIQKSDAPRLTKALDIADVYNYPPIVQLLVDNGVNLTTLNASGRTPLHTAAMKNQLALVVAMVNVAKRENRAARDAIINAKCSINNWTPLHYASNGGHLEIVRYLVENAGADPNEPSYSMMSFIGGDVGGTTALHLAAAEGRGAVCRYLVEVAGVDAGFPDSEGSTALHRAAVNPNSFDLLDFLGNECGCDINRPGSGGSTPLHCAVHHGNLNVVIFLLDELDSDPQQTNWSEETALHIAAARGHDRIVELFLRREVVDATTLDENSDTALHIAAERGLTKVVNVFLNFLPASIRQKLVNETTIDGHTALHLAAKKGYFDVVHLLLKEGAATARTSNHRHARTPLMSAAMGGHCQIVDLLLKESDSDVHATDLGFRHALHYGATCKHADVISSLLTHATIGVDTPDDVGRTALHCAAKHGGAEVVVRLLEAKADLNLTDDYAGFNAMHRCAQKDNVDALKVLVDAKGNVHTPFTTGSMGPSFVLHIAAWSGSLKVARYLVLDAGVDPLIRGWCRTTPLHYASTAAVPTVSKFLLEHLASAHGLECVAAAVATCTDEGISALHNAVGAGSFSQAKLLIDYLRKPATFLLKKFAWHLSRHRIGSIIQSRLLQKICQMAVPSAPALLNQPNKYGHTPIEMATTSQCAMFLLRAKAGISQRHRSSRFPGLATTPLHEAAARADTSMVQLLVDAKASPSVKPGETDRSDGGQAAVPASTILNVEQLTTEAVQSSCPGFHCKTPDIDDDDDGDESAPESPGIIYLGCDDDESDDSSGFDSYCPGPGDSHVEIEVCDIDLDPCKHRVPTKLSEDFF